MRLGAYACRVLPNTKLSEIYDRDMVLERHRHRWEFNNAYREQLKKAGLTASGVFEKRDLVEVVEITDREFFVGVQYHPEFKSKPLTPHPLFDHFIAASLKLHLNANSTQSLQA
jgi:CTP synthase